MVLTAKDLDRIEFGDLVDRLMKEVKKIREELALRKNRSPQSEDFLISPHHPLPDLVRMVPAVDFSSSNI